VCLDTVGFKRFQHPATHVLLWEFGCAHALPTSKRPFYTCSHLSLQCGATHPMCFASFVFFGCSNTLSPAICWEMSRIGRAMLLQIFQLWPCDAEWWRWHQHDLRHLWRGKLGKRHSLASIPRFSQLQAPLKDLQKSTILYPKYLSSLKLMLRRRSCVVVLFEPSTRKTNAVRVQGFQKTLKPLVVKTSRKDVFDPSQLIMLTNCLVCPAWKS
jgi:hypothetical protein